MTYAVEHHKDSYKLPLLRRLQRDFVRLGNDIGVYPCQELKDRYHFQALHRKEWPTKMNLRIESRQKCASTVRWRRCPFSIFLLAVLLIATTASI